MLDILYLAAAVAFLIFIIYVLYSITQSLKGIDSSLQRIADTDPEEE